MGGGEGESEGESFFHGEEGPEGGVEWILGHKPPSVEEADSSRGCDHN